MAMKIQERARRLLLNARSISVLTGAGVSAESGIPTFRGAGGFWAGGRAEDLATPEGFARDPRKVWAFYNWRRSQLAQCRPNPGHFALARLEARTEDFTLITQNVDGLHQAAGSRKVLEVHGNLWRIRCVGCGRERDAVGEALPDEPRCESCGERLRPGVVWFGELLPEQTFADALAAAARCEVMLVVGTSAVVYPAAGLIAHAKEYGARVIEVNVEATEASPFVDLSVIGPSGVVLPALMDDGRAGGRPAPA
jgi:NAD-dependent deacetylase